MKSATCTCPDWQFRNYLGQTESDIAKRSGKDIGLTDNGDETWTTDNGYIVELFDASYRSPVYLCKHIIAVLEHLHGPCRFIKTQNDKCLFEIGDWFVIKRLTLFG